MTNLRALADRAPHSSYRASEQGSLPPGLLSLLRGCSVEQLDEIRTVAAQLIDERAAALTVADVKPLILTAASAINQEAGRGGIVPLDALRRQMPAVPRALLDAALLDMEQLGAIALKPAQSLRSQRAQHGITSERGLLFFLIVQV